ncbi:FG-GAP repeat protein [Planctomycetes bacterium Pla163]|uniref:FG-GAP repeat protein n=1 Tax=Rohdeia mirabilis TaxID=2528008 RepID=A0A518CXM8_9BACT|nr:FG-GAP repeat protein [Planctomycetes bacterium Pla163]
MKSPTCLLVAAALLSLPSNAQDGCVPEWTSLGGGSMGGPGVPRLVYEGSPVVGAPLRLRFENGPPLAHGCVGFGLHQHEVPLPFFGAVAHVGFPLFSLETFTLDDLGCSPWLLDVSSVSPNLCGLTFFAQGMVQDALGQGSTTFTDARRVSFGTVNERSQFPGRTTQLGIGLEDLVFGDFDLDGHCDVIVSGGFNTTPLWFLAGDGLGGFADPTYTISSDMDARGAAAGDFDQDGCLDVAVTNIDPIGEVRIFFGACDGTFPRSSSAFVGAGSWRIAVADLDGNNTLDLVTTTGTETVHVLLGDGQGSFGPPTAHATASSTTVLVPHDFTGDGIVDILTNGKSGVGIALLAGLGGGLFAPASFLPTGLVNGEALDVIDVDGNGLLDICYAQPFTLSVNAMLQTAPGIFQDPISTPTDLLSKRLVAADFDGDGFADVVVENESANEVVLLQGDGTGNFSITDRTVVSDYTRDFGLVDVHGDGQLDVVVGSIGNSLTLVEGTALGDLRGVGSTPVGLSPRALECADWDNDGNLDIAIIQSEPQSQQRNIAILKGDGMGGFVETDLEPTVNSAHVLMAAHLNDDSHFDFVTLDSQVDEVVIHFGSLGARVAPPVSFPCAQGPHGLASGDFDEDGNNDLALICTHGVHRKTYALQLFMGSATGGFSAPVSLPVVDAPTALAVGDFDGDGDMDLAVGHSNSLDTFSLYLGDGAGNFSQALTWNDFDIAQPRTIEVLDVNDDAIDDIVVGSLEQDRVFVLLGAPGGALQLASNIKVGTSLWDLAVGDLDGDAIPDHVALDQSIDELVIHFGNGDGTFERPMSFASGSAASEVVIGDFTGDGLQDILAINPGTSSLALFENGLFRSSD